MAPTVGHISVGKPLVLLQVNFRGICNKILEFWNLTDTLNPDVVIGTESWLSEEINNGEVLGTTAPGNNTIAVNNNNNNNNYYYYYTIWISPVTGLSFPALLLNQR